MKHRRRNIFLLILFCLSALGLASRTPITLNGSPIKKFYPQGEVRGTTGYYYTKDHLGSTREVLDGNSNIVARYDYDPYGVPTQTAGTMQFDRLFTGHFYHERSGLFLAPYRAYNPALLHGQCENLSWPRWLEKFVIQISRPLARNFPTLLVDSSF